MLFLPCTNSQRAHFWGGRLRRLFATCTVACLPVTAGSQSLQLVPTITNFAGTGGAGYAGDAGLAVNAELNAPGGIAFAANGNAYISDYINHRIRVVDAMGMMTTAYGNGGNCTTPTSTPNACGDGGPAADATFTNPAGLVFDAGGNLFIADYGAFRVRRIDASTGIITTVAGTGVSTYNGDGISATTAGLVGPHNVAVDTTGNLYISDRDGNRLRKVTTGTGLISTIAGTGVAGYNGDAIAATTAELNGQMGIAMDASGNLYIADTLNQRIRKISVGSGLISTLAGDGAAGFSGDGSAAISAALNGPEDVHMDAAGDLLIADSNNARLREVFVASGLIETIAGDASLCSPTAPCGDNGPATSADLLLPEAVTLDGLGNVTIVDQGANRIRTVSSNVVFATTPIGSSAVQTVNLLVADAPITITSISVSPSQGGVQEYTVGSISGCSVNGSTLNAIGTVCSVPVTFKPGYPGARPLALSTVTSGGAFHFGMNGIGVGPQIAVSPGTLSTFAGTGTEGYSGDNGPASSAAIGAPLYGYVDTVGNLYFADPHNNAIREVLASNGNILTVAGNGTQCNSSLAACGDGGLATAAQFSSPTAVVLDAPGNMYITDNGDQRIRKVDADTGIITTIAGNGHYYASGDGGPATAAALMSPIHTVVDGGGNLYIASTDGNAVRFVSHATGIITTIAGNGTACSSSTDLCGDGGPAGGGDSMLNYPAGLALDGSGNLLIADSGDNRIRRIDQATGKISTVAGSGLAGYSGDGGLAGSAQLNTPLGVALDAADDLLIADTGNASIRMVSAATGGIATVVGNGFPCGDTYTTNCGDGGLANTASLVFPYAVMLDSLGNLYVADISESRVRKVTQLAPTLAFATTTIGITSPDSPQIEMVNDIGNAPLLQPPPSSGLNPSITGSFSFDPSGTCLQLSPGSSAVSLPAGASCTYAIDFTPQTAGSFSGVAMGTDNSLNVNQAVQIVLLTGSATQSGTATSLASSLNPSSFGDSVTLASHITAPVDGPSPTGVVTFYSVATVATVNLQATASSSTTLQNLPLAAGTYTVSVIGDTGSGLYAAWNPAPDPSVNDEWTDSYGVELCNACDAIVQTANDPYTTAFAALADYETVESLSAYDSVSEATTLVPNPYTFTLTSPQTVSFFVPGGNFANGAFAAGTDFSDASGGLSLNLTTIRPIGSATLNGAAVATLGIATLSVGSLPILAVYSGDNNYVGSSSTVVTQVVNKAAGPDTLTASLASLNYGEAVSLTDTLPISNGISPTGAVTFYNGTNVLGTGTVNTTAGVATATLSIASLPVGSDVITANYAGDGSYATVIAGPVTETVFKSTATDILTGSNAAPVYQTAITLTDAIQIVDGITPGGTITFLNDGVSIGTGGLNNAGIATLITSDLPPGSDTLTASYGGDSHYAASVSNGITETVSRLAATDTLTSTNMTPDYGQAVTITDFIPTLDGVAMTGTVTFYDEVVSIGTSPASGGQATFMTSSLPVGSDAITAVYSGNADYTPSTTVALVEMVAGLSASNTLATSNAMPTSTASVTLTDTLSTVNGVPPTGTITFFNGTMPLSTVPVEAGISTFTGLLPAGRDVLTSVYAGDGHYNASTSNAVIVTVARLAETDTLTTSDATPTPAESITITDRLAMADGIAMTGTVTFYRGALAVGVSPVAAGRAVFQGIFPVGVAAVTGVYSGDANYAASISNGIVETVARYTSAVVLTASGHSPVYGQSITLTAALPLVAGVPITGTLTFFNGSTAVGTVAVNAGEAHLAFGPLPSGNSIMSAVYSGDSNYSPVSSNLVSIDVGKLLAHASLAVSNVAPTVGETVTLTAALAPTDNIVPSGEITFLNGTTVLGTAPLVNAAAILTTSSLPVGAAAVTVSYPGNAAYQPAVTAPVSIIVNPLPIDFSIAATPASQTVDPGASATYSLTLAGLGGTFSAPVLFSATGLPPGATASFAPASVVPGAGPTTTRVTVTTGEAQAGLRQSGKTTIFAALLFGLPLLLMRKFRGNVLAVLLLSVATLAGTGSLAGCAGGYFGGAEQHHVITITATSGSLSHFTTVTLSVR